MVKAGVESLRVGGGVGGGVVVQSAHCAVPG